MSYVSLIGGSEVGRDHFPFIVPDYDPNTLYPLGLSLHDAARWTMQIKTWSLTGTITFDVTAPSRHITITFSTGTKIRADKANIGGGTTVLIDASEIVVYYETVIYETVYLISGGTGISFEEGPGFGICGTGNSAGNGDFAPYQLIFSGGLFYPSLGFGGRIVGPAGIEGFTVLLNTADDDTGVHENVGNIVVDGLNVHVYEEIGDTFVSNVVVDLVVEPTEFWVFDGPPSLPANVEMITQRYPYPSTYPPITGVPSTLNVKTDSQPWIPI